MTYTEYYNKYKADSAHIESAFKHLVDYTHIKKLYNDEKLENDFSNKMESNQPFTFIPSMIYTFRYAPPDMQGMNGIKFIDNVPLVFVMDYSNSSVMGLNFNLIPSDYRAAVLDIINDTDTEFYNNVLGTDEFILNGAIANYFNNSESRTAFVKYINSKLSSKISAAYRIYKIKYCTNVRLIEYDMWKYIPFLNFKGSIREANLEELQKKVLVK